MFKNLKAADVNFEKTIKIQAEICGGNYIKRDNVPLDNVQNSKPKTKKLVKAKGYTKNKKLNRRCNFDKRK